MVARTAKKEGYARGHWWVRLFEDGNQVGFKGFAGFSIKDFDREYRKGQRTRDAWIKKWIKHKINA